MANDGGNLLFDDTGAPSSPCKNGFLRCSSNESGVIELKNVFGIPFPFYNKKIGEDSDGKCIFECGCLFPAGQIPGMPKYAPVYVTSKRV